MPITRAGLFGALAAYLGFAPKGVAPTGFGSVIVTDSALAAVSVTDAEATSL